MEFRGAMGGIYRLTEWITRFAATNLLWALCSSPFIFFVILKLIAMSNQWADNSLVMNYAMAIVAPLTLFPATAAMFTVVRKWVMGDSDVPVFKTFFRGYRDNYKQSLVGGLFYTMLIVIMYVDYTIYMTQLKNLQLLGIIMLILLIILFVSLFNFFSMVAHYHMTIGQILKNCILLTLIRPFRVFSTLIGCAVLIYIGIHYPVLYVFFIPCLMAWLAFFNFYGTFMKMQSQAEKLQQDKEGQEKTDSEPEEK